MDGILAAWARTLLFLTAKKYFYLSESLRVWVGPGCCKDPVERHWDYLGNKTQNKNKKQSHRTLSLVLPSNAMMPTAWTLPRNSSSKDIIKQIDSHPARVKTSSKPTLCSYR